MINCIIFVLKPSHYEVLRELLLLIKAEDYRWSVGDSDIYALPSLENILTKGNYHGQEIIEALNQKIFYVFSEFFAFKTSNIAPPKSYKELSESDCEIAIFIVDSDYYSVYVKNDALFDSVKRFVSESDCIRSEVINNENASLYFGI